MPKSSNHKNHFFISYAGNKRNEVDEIFDYIKDKLDCINIIVEPFCGTSAFSYYLSLLYPKKFKYILNDNNKYLIELYNIAKDEIKYNKLIEDLNLLTKDIDKEKYNKIVKEDTLNGWTIKNKIYTIRAGLYPLEETKKKRDFESFRTIPIINFLRTENIEFSNIDGIEIIKKYESNPNALIFIDPPYLLTCNDFYKNPNVNIYEYLNSNNIDNNKSFTILVLEDNWIIKLLFKNNIKRTYDKIYQTTKKHTSHLLISNK